MSTAAEPRSNALPPEVKKIAIVVVIGAIMSILDTTIVNVALQTLREDFDTSLTTVQWISTGYLLALATVIPLTGWSAERFGTKRVWIGVVVMFVVTSALCGAAWSIDSLIAFRVLQGLAGGMIMPVGMIALAQAAGPQRMGRVMSVVGVPMVLGPVLGPVIGGLIIDNISWRWIFYVNVPVGAVGLVLATKLLPAGRALGRAAQEGHERPPLDWLGLILGCPGVALLVFGMSEYGSKSSFGATSVWLPFVIGIAALVAFVVHARTAEHPLVDIKLFRGAGFSAAAGTVFLVGLALFGAMVLLPLYYQIDRGQSPLEAGLLLMPQGVGAAAGMSLGGRLTDRYGAGRVVLAGLAILTAGTVVFATVDATTPYWLLSIGLFVRGLGLGGAMMPSMAGAYATLRSEQVPRATPMLNVVQRVGGSIGAALLTVILQNGIADRVGISGGGVEGAQLSDAARQRVAAPIADAFAHTYLWALILTAVAFIPAAVLAVAESRARKAKAAATAADGVEQPEVPAAA
jgi:EmrB/QacA subfamily drug resistance transporter